MNGSFGSPANTKFCLGLHYNVDNSYFFVNGKKMFKFKADNKNVNFPTHFCLGSISNGFSSIESREVSLNFHFEISICKIPIMIFQSITILLINLAN